MFLESLLHSDHSVVLTLLAAFAAGVLASFTPCIYPMLPITVGVITAQKTASMLTNFFLALAYGLGIATIYATLGYLSATTNILFGQWLANPYFVGLMVAFFLYLAGTMFGFYEMYTPRFLTASATVKRNGSFGYSFLCGLLTGAAASPCLTPALALLLGFVAKQQNPALGFAVLFSFAMGLSSLLIVLGTFSSAVSSLPRAGAWMHEVKKIFGFLLFGVAIYFLEPIASNTVVMSLYSLVACAAGIYYGLRARTAAYFKIPFALLSFLLFIVAQLLAFSAYYNLNLERFLDEISNVLL